MRQQKLVDARFLRHAAAEPGMKMSGAGSIFRKGAIQDREVGPSTKPDEAVAIEGISRISHGMVLKFDPVSQAVEPGGVGDGGGPDPCLAKAEAAI